MSGTNFRQTVKTVVNTLVEKTHWADRALRKPLPAPCWIVLAYHRIVDSGDEDPLAMGMCTLREDFAAHLAYLKAHFPVLPVSEGIERLDSDEPGLYFSITLDDGYADNLKQAAPELQAANLPATVFVATGGLRAGNALWWDRVIAAVYGSPLDSLDCEGLGLPALAKRESLSAQARSGLTQRILDSLWHMPQIAVAPLLEQLEQRLQAPKDVLVAPRMDDAQLRELAASGIDIQVHGSSHHDMAAMPLAMAIEDIESCRRYLQRCLGAAELQGFAYPGGRSSADLRFALRKLGYRYAFSADRGVNTAATDLMQLQRMMVADSDLADFKRCLAMLVKAHRG